MIRMTKNRVPDGRGGRASWIAGRWRLTMFAGLVCRLLAAGSASAGEPDYDSACANWNPILYQCTVLSAKNGQSKFVASFRGGLHTVYVSEVLGHCPLIADGDTLRTPEGKVRLLWKAPEGDEGRNRLARSRTDLGRVGPAR